MRQQELVGERRLPHALQERSLVRHQGLSRNTLLQLCIQLQLARRKGLYRVAIQLGQRVTLGEQQLLELAQDLGCGRRPRSGRRYRSG